MSFRRGVSIKKTVLKFICNLINFGKHICQKAVDKVYLSQIFEIFEDISIFVVKILLIALLTIQEFRHFLNSKNNIQTQFYFLQIKHRINFIWKNRNITINYGSFLKIGILKKQKKINLDDKLKSYKSLSKNTILGCQGQNNKWLVEPKTLIASLYGQVKCHKEEFRCV